MNENDFLILNHGESEVLEDFATRKEALEWLTSDGVAEGTYVLAKIQRRNIVVGTVPAKRTVGLGESTTHRRRPAAVVEAVPDTGSGSAA